MAEGLPRGKLPPELLVRLLAMLPAGGPRVLVPARAGVDAAAIDLGDRVLVAASDPITFVAERIGWYAVNVNANDIAVMGAAPRWFLATLLLPEGITEASIAAIFADLADACTQLGVALVGGHTEVTQGIDRPIVAGTMLGEAAPGRLVTSAGMQPGDRVLITGGIAIEGTAVLAVEARDELLACGISAPVIERAARLLDDPGISVVRAAWALTNAVPVHAMHDATEGGLATALREMAEASGTGLAIEGDAVPVLPETQAVCHALGLDPLGLLASGCLIAAVAPADEAAALAALHAAHIGAWPVGRATVAGAVLWQREGGEPRELPVFARDELARWLARMIHHGGTEPRRGV
jgi:hydrogenase expression/formation protein HypE